MDEDYEDEEVVESNEIEAIDEEGVSEESSVLKSMYLQHPECSVDFIEEIYKKVTPLYTEDGKDLNHKSIPFMTLYEKTKILGIRTNQLSNGAKPFVVVPKHVTDITDIARLELEQKRIPFIVKRPMPNGKYEYWRVSDLMMI